MLGYRSIVLYNLLLCFSLSGNRAHGFNNPGRGKSQISQISAIKKFPTQEATERHFGFRDTLTTAMQSKGTSEAEDQMDESSSWMWLVTLVLPLQLVYISNQWSRSSIYYLVNFSEGADAFRAMK